MIEDCTASNNGNWGISTFGNVTGSTAIANNKGIEGANVAGSIVQGNTSTGMLVHGESNGNTSLDNGGVGISGSDFVDCVVVRNGSGLEISGTGIRNYVAENHGNGCSGGTIDSCSILGHSGYGALNTDSVINSWLVNNSMGGLFNPGTVQNCGVRYNMAFGIRNATRMNGSILYDNGGFAGYDYLEARFNKDLPQVDLTGNYWGPQTTAFMNSNGWGTSADVPKIFDFFDNNFLTEAVYDNHLSSSSGAGPDLSPPAFLLSATPNMDDPVSVGVMEFKLEFSEVLNESIAPIVTFGREFPFTDHVVDASAWTATTTASSV
ncbi:MAG: hypothetical protein KC917_19595, partial [Candidatus Omnitrophica bacterium]|nr:hypothetical protein [Candidatus Omnitrophota bacterium]